MQATLIHNNSIDTIVKLYWYSTVIWVFVETGSLKWFINVFASCLIACFFLRASLRYWMNWSGKYIQTGSLVADKRKIYLIGNGAHYILLWLYTFYPTATPSNVYQQQFFVRLRIWGIFDAFTFSIEWHYICCFRTERLPFWYCRGILIKRVNRTTKSRAV